MATTCSSLVLLSLLGACQAGRQHHALQPVGCHEMQDAEIQRMWSDLPPLGQYEALHRSHALHIEDPLCRAVVYVQTSELCGIELYSQPAADCGATPIKDLMEPRRLAARLAESGEERAFGVELELVSKHPNSKQCIADKSGVGSRTARLLRSHSMEGCSTHEDCSAVEYCRKAQADAWRAQARVSHCKLREECSSAKSVDGTCPVSPTKWEWTFDGSVKPLRKADADILGVGSEETSGSSFELVSPVLQGLVGLTSVAETLASLQHMAVQAGPSAGMHVHVNAGKDGIAGVRLDAAAVFNVWTSYARFQFVIYSMLQDSRIMNRMATPLIFKDHVRALAYQIAGGTSSSLHPVHEEGNSVFKLNQRLFHNMQNAIGKFYSSLTDLCRVVFETEYWANRNPCDADGEFDRPHERESQVNLLSLARHGTLEFRAFPATHDPERAVRWVAFILKFVEVFQKDGRFAKSDLQELECAQFEATFDDLENELGMNLDYWRERPWLQRGNRACAPLPK